MVDEAITTADGYVNGAASVAAFELLAGLYDRGCLSPNLLGGGIGTAQGHGTGHYAMIVDGPWMVDIYAADFPDFASESGFRPPQSEFIDGVTFDGSKPNAYLAQFPIGLKGDDRIE